MATTSTKVLATPERVRAWRAARQGMGGLFAGLGAAEVLSRAGWVRSVGGAAPYLTLRDRAGLSREAVDRAVASAEIHELPSARGCTYVVPAEDYALALRAGQGRGDEAEAATAKKYCGVTDAELDRLERAVLDALAKGALDPAEIKEAAGGAVRSLGPEGKKRGLSTTLPIALGRLQSRGEIRRVPFDGRLDRQRYRYVRWAPSPLAGVTLTDDEVARGLAERFFRWAAPATVAEFAWWSGLGVRAARATAAGLGVVALADGDERMMLPDDREALLATEVPSEPRYSFVSSLDNVTHFRREAASLLDPEDAARRVKGSKGLAESLGSFGDLPHNPVVDRGRIVGLWEYDGVRGALAWTAFGKAPKAMAKAADELASYVAAELGDARLFSLDSPESRVERIRALVPGW